VIESVTIGDIISGLVPLAGILIYGARQGARIDAMKESIDALTDQVRTQNGRVGIVERKLAGVEAAERVRAEIANHNGSR
jgi:hypothetical protein